MMDEKNTYTTKQNKTAHRQGHAHTTGYGYDKKTRRLDVRSIRSCSFVFFDDQKEKPFFDSI